MHEEPAGPLWVKGRHQGSSSFVCFALKAATFLSPLNFMVFPRKKEKDHAIYP